MRRSLATLLLFLSFAVVSWWPLISRPALTLATDWDYFNALALFVRSATSVYHVFPLHDPWRCGGVDVLANPQSRLFSPPAWGDWVLAPNVANLVWLVTNLAFGAWGAWRLWRSLGLRPLFAIAFTWIFINASWLTQHLIVGHMTFVLFAQLPWLIVAARSIEQRWARWVLLALPTYWLLSGGHYALVFGFYLVATCLTLRLLRTSWPRLLNAFIADWRFTLGLFVALVAAAFARFAPTLQSAVLALREPEIHKAWHYPWDVFFNPLQLAKPGRDYGSLHMGGYPVPLHFAEVACYVGFLALCVILGAAIVRRRVLIGYLVAIALWTWTGLAVGGLVNPGAIHAQLPLLQSVHVQTRFLFIAYFFLLLLLARSVQWLPRSIAWVVAIALAAEASFVHYYPLQRAAADMVPAETELITARAYTGTANTGFFLRDYYDTQGTRVCYEPSMNLLITKPSASKNYRGEVYFEDAGGEATLREYTPAGLIVDYDAGTSDGRLSFNTNHLGGFEIVAGPPGARVLSSTRELLRLEGVTGSGFLTLRYAPWYEWPVIAASVASLLALVVTGLKTRRREAKYGGRGI